MIKKEYFGTIDGKSVYNYTLKDGITVVLTEFGARILSIVAPDRNGVGVDVIAGAADFEQVTTGFKYMGATIGRCGNRIGGDGFELNGVFHKIWHPEGVAHLHGGKEGFDCKVFTATADEENNCVIMTYLSPDGEEGYPGNLELSVKFTVKGCELDIEYFAVCDKDTVFNPTNHAYFNLSGEGFGSNAENVLKINADAYIPTDEKLVPTGEIKPVKGTPFDFNEFKPIGRDIDADDKDLKIAGGFDHNFCLTDSHFAIAYSDETGIKMDCYTDLPGVQFYAGNFLNGKKGKSVYPKRAAFCLETQFFPDAIHHTNFKRPVLKANEKFYSKTTYAFSIKK